MSGGFTHSDDGFGDDRLLACALGLGDDPELQTALESSPALARRLAQMRIDVSTVSDRLQTAIPAADPDYADPAAARWQRLQPYFAAEMAPARRAPRGRLAAVAAVIAIFAVTVAVAVQQLPGGSRSDQTAETTRSVGGGAPAAPPADTKGLAEDSNAVPLPQAEQFATVCVARAGQADGGGQHFRVVRVLKGQAGRRLVIALGDGSAPFAVGSLQILYLHPLVAQAGQPQDDGSVAAGETQPTPLPATTMNGGTTMPPAVGGYGLGDEAALVQALPDGVDISTLTAP